LKVAKRKQTDRLLDLRGMTWWFKRDIPAKLRPALADPLTGQQKATYLVNLKTGDVRKARQLRDELETETDKLFREIREGKVPSSAQMAAHERGILAREAIEAAAEIDQNDPDGFGPLEAARWAAEATADSFREGADRKAFLDALHGRTAVGDHLEAYLAAADFAPKTRNERRGNIGQFVKWVTARKPVLTLDQIDRKQAGKYVSEVIDMMHPQTQKKHLAALRGYWRWLAARGHVELPTTTQRDAGWPWDGQQVQRNGKRVERGSKDDERPFTDAEINALLYAPCPEGTNQDHANQIKDALRISLLSGMRMAEVLTLWVEEVRNGPEGAGLVFDIQQGKTDAAARPVPVHPDLEEIVQRRLRDGSGHDKRGKDWLFHELANERDPGDTFGKRFRRYRLALGVDDKREGKRRSLVNFHSARRWFATAADRAGQQEAVIKDVVGHVPDKKNVTRSAYIAASSGAQRRACVDAVRLPKPD
jgi:integrase